MEEGKKKNEGIVNYEWGSDTIIVRDGLLRTKSFKRELFPKIDEKIRKGIENHSRKNVNIAIVPGVLL